MFHALAVVSLVTIAVGLATIAAPRQEIAGMVIATHTYPHDVVVRWIGRGRAEQLAVIAGVGGVGAIGTVLSISGVVIFGQSAVNP